MATAGLPNFANFFGPASAQAGQLLNPILDMLTRRQQEEAAEAQRRALEQIAGAERAYAAARDPMAQIYGGAINQATAVEEAIARRLAGQATDQSENFARRLAEIGAPSSAEQAAKNREQWNNLPAVGYTMGMNDVKNLISRGAGAREYLEKQPQIARREYESDLNETLRKLSSDYADQRNQVTARVPEEIYKLQQDMYGRAVEKRQYEDKLKADAADRKAALQEQYLKERALLLQFGQQNRLKRLDQQFKAQQAALNRELQAAIAQLGADTKLATDNPTPVASGPGMKFNPDGSPNPNYNPGGTSSSLADQRVRENQARAAINIQFFNPNTRAPRQNTPTSVAALNGQINRILNEHKIDPFKGVGVSIRQSALTRLGFRRNKQGKWFRPTG